MATRRDGGHVTPRRFPPDRLRVVVLTNEQEGPLAGHQDAYSLLEASGEVESVDWISPKSIAASKGHGEALRALVEIVDVSRPDVVVALTPSGFAYPDDWFQAVRTSPSHPRLVYWEGDAWSRWSKPPTPDVRAWWRHADVVFSVALGAQRTLIERHGAHDVRFIPQTYDHIRYALQEAEEPPTSADSSDVVVIGNHWGSRYFSRLRGGRQRMRLVRTLQDDERVPLALYGQNWTGRGARGPLPFAEQAAAAREGLLTANWDYFPTHAAYTSNRLAILLIAGRAHVNTRHPAMDWLPGPEAGLFLEPTVDAVVGRVRELLARPREEVLELGLAAHRWIRHRLSDREMARYVLGAVDPRLLESLPADPWRRLPS